MKRSSLISSESSLLGFIRGYYQTYGMSPSIREMAIGTGTSSTSAVRARLQNLEELGWVTRRYAVARSVRLIGTPVAMGESWYSRSGFEIDSA